METDGGVEDRFSRRVKFEREARDLSQADLARLLSEKGLRTHPTTIAKIESREGDRPRSIKLDEAAALAEVFGTSLDELLGRPRIFDRQAAVDRVSQASIRALRDMAKAIEPLEQALAALNLDPDELRRTADLLDQDLVEVPDDGPSFKRAVLMVDEYTHVRSKLRMASDSIGVLAGYASMSQAKLNREFADMTERINRKAERGHASDS